MTERSYLRRRPNALSRWRRSPLRRAGAVIIVFLALALVQTAVSVQTTRLSREVCDAREAIQSLESDIDFLVRQNAALRDRSVGLMELRDREGFATPDSGRVVAVWAEAIDTRRDSGGDHGVD